MTPLDVKGWLALGAVPMLGNERAPDDWIEVQRDDGAHGLPRSFADEDAACAVARATGVGIAMLYNDASGAMLPLDTREGEEACTDVRADVRAAIERQIEAGDDENEGEPPSWIVIVPEVCLAPDARRSGGASD